jgi:hypothetical protein
MSGTGYRMLGFVVWQGARFYARRRYGNKPRNILIGLLVAGGVGAALAAQRRGGDDQS